MEKIDWSPLDGYKKSICSCRCGSVYKSHYKGIWEEGHYVRVTREPCPGCGRHDNCEKIVSEPEMFRI